MTLPSGNTEDVNYHVTIDAADALAALKDISTNATNFDSRVQLMIEQIQIFAEQSGIALSSVASDFKALDASMSGGGSSLFGSVSKVGWEDINAGLTTTTESLKINTEVTQQNVLTGKEAEQVHLAMAAALGDEAALSMMASQGITAESVAIAKLSAEEKATALSIPEHVDGLKQISTEEGLVGTSAKQMGEDGAAGAQTFAHGIDFVRTALGTLSAMLVFQVIQAITTTFTNAIGYANQYYNALFQISVAQDVLARGGMNVNQQQLVDTAKQWEAEWKIISTTDATTLVAQTALLTKNLGLSVDQMKLLGDYAITLSVQQTGSAKDAQTNLDQLVRSLQTGSSSAALEKIGVGFKAIDVEAEAVRLHLIQQGQTLDDNSRALATFSLIQKAITPEYQKMVDVASTIPGQGEQANVAWTNFLTQLGTLLSPVLTGLKEIFYLFITNIAIPALQGLIQTASVFFGTMAAGFEFLNSAIHGHIMSLDELNAKLKETIGFYDKAFNPSVGGTNTPVGTPAPSSGGNIDMSKVNTLMDNFFKDVVQFQDQLQKAQEDFELKMKNMAENYALQRQKTIEDYNNSVQKEMQNFHLKQEEQTKAHYQKLKDLQNSYLFDLEEALRHRDALAVLKLEEKYNLDVNKENDSFKQQQENDAKNEALKLAQMKKDEQLRLKQEADAYALQQKQAQEAYDLQKEQAKRAQDEKMQELAQALAKALGLNAEGADAIYKLLNSYYGQNGYFDGLYSYSYASLVGRSQQLLSALQQMVAQFSSILGGGGFVGGGFNPSRDGSGGNTTSGSKGGSDKSKANGGVDFASSSTGLTFGEAGPEMAITVPLGGSTNPSFSGFGGGGGGGMFHILVEMHPDLVGKIVNQSMDATAEVVTRLNRGS